MEKTTEELQAQIEAFAGFEATPLSRDSERDQILFLAFADKLARAEMQNPEFERLVKVYKSQYVDFLRKKDGRELVKRLGESISRYNEEFSEIAYQLKDQIDEVGEPERTPSFLGRGGTATTYKVEAGGELYVFKLFGPDDEDENSVFENVYDVYSALKALIFAEGIERVPQLVAHSLKDQVVVMTLRPGRPVADNTPGESEQFTDEEIIQLIHTLQIMHERGLANDYYPDNLLYDEVIGFSVLDPYYVGEDVHYSIEKQVMRLRRMLVGDSYRDFCYRDFEDYCAQSTEQNIERRHESLNLGLRILRITKEYFPDIFEAFQRTEPSRILELGEVSAFYEFSKDNPYDKYILDQALTILK